LDTRRGQSDFSYAARFSSRLVTYLIEKKAFAGLTLNVNIPSLPENGIKGIAVTKQGAARLVEVFEKRLDPRSNTYYWLAGETLFPEKESMESDAWALSKGYISITPIQHDLTCHTAIGEVRHSLKDFVL
ncbi:MAG: 5'/3'-nucleotidase SurE, partial [Syntrophales bacterium]|nr:5'/3'-nucleotidase SurE [Syntrophales bacterium]